MSDHEDYFTPPTGHALLRETLLLLALCVGAISALGVVVYLTAT